MPKPPIPSSASDSLVSKSHLPSSSRSFSSSLPSPRPSSSWRKRVFKQALSSPGKNNLSRHSDLTEESLEAYNRRNEFSPSPYYRGLTDSSLYISRQRAPSSPGRESHATTVATSSSISTLIIKVQKWTSTCFTSKSGRGEEDDVEEPRVEAKPAASSSSSSSKSRGTVLTVMKEESCSLGISNDVVSVNPEKPLRERVSEVEVPAPIISQKRVVFVENGETVSGDNGKNKDFTWADKYRPKALPDFICNRDKAVQLQDLVKVEQHPHFIFEGLAGVGKKTMISAFLREVFGHDRVQTREECKEFYLKGESIRSIRVNVKVSCHHIEVNLSDLKGYEKQVIVQLIHETGNNRANKAVRVNQEVQCNQDNRYAIVLYEAEKLSTEAVLYFKWLLDKYEGHNMVFFSCSDTSKLQPIKSLCTMIQLLPPSDEEIVEVLEFIAKQESINLPRELAEKIVGNSKNNLRQAIRSFEATWKFKYPFEEDQEIRTGWEDDIARIAKNIIEEQTPKQLYNIRGKLQKLTEHNVASEFIYKTLVAQLKMQLNCSYLQIRFDSIFDDYYREEGSMQREDGSMLETDRSFARNRHEEMGKRLNDPTRKNAHDVLKIEESIAKFMSCYKSLLSNQVVP
ncbi:uncharacterized protein LOC117932681 [Vitis riparia]|uniref:uncharacterized protein LOC117932681 n=1 Tax=Vitis riparia TaxID=96939 RepID=UPI00155B03D0|nr:uncharacterized protein LOC117932681 [Vitis riparia]